MNLSQAIQDLKQQRDQINAAISALEQLGDTGAPSVAVTVSKKRRMSAAGRKAIVAAVRRRWAKVQGETPKKRKMSAAARKRIGAAKKAWWKARKAGK